MHTPIAHGRVQPGLYLQVPSGETWALTTDNIEACSRAIFADPSKLPEAVQQAEMFQVCTICPKRGAGEACHAIRPILAVWDRFEGYTSFDPVRAEYRSRSGDVVVSTDTTMQRALQFVSVMSLLYYCEVGKKYWKHFYGVHPLMPIDDLVTRVYLNMFWACGGNTTATQALINTFHEEISTTTRCQMERIRLFCHNDVLLNALILTQLASQFLAMNVEDTLRERVESFEQSFFG
jgi:hypothetical protein